MDNNASVSSDMNTGGQTTTQNPQASTPSSSFDGSSSSAIQPVSTANLLTSNQNAIPLQIKPLSTVDFPQAVTSSQIAPQVKTSYHQTNLIFLGFAGLLLLVALVSFWLIYRSAKSTTKY